MYVYILECSDGSYYTGVTNDMDRRLFEHQSQEDPNCYTATRLPVALRYCGHFYGNPDNAIAFEKQIKGWSRAKKESLMNEDWDIIKELAMNQRKKNMLNKKQ